MDVVPYLKKIEKFGKDNFMFNISRETAEFLSILSRLKNPKKILEVGTSNGYSTIWLAKSCDAMIWTIEILEKKYPLAVENFKNLKLDKRINAIHGDAILEIPKLKGKFDLVFLDAVKKDYIKYIGLIEPLLAKDALIIADNIVSHKKRAREYIDYMNKNYFSSIIDIGQGLMVSLKHHL
ncbi:methyltransferase domain-containing protein [Candidatus Woesearchaeota archaeon]|nr:methyltransferase domain-containing protein [Candidatus Woesearchaeota archaeon]